MYETFFNLKAKPFELVPNPDFLFLSRSHKKALTYLDYGIKERAGFILLTGEVGSGKTTIVRDLIKGLNGKVTLSKVFNTKVSSEQLVSMINEDFGLSVEGKDKVTLLRELNDFLIDRYANRCQPILIIDEAQNLTPELLEEIRMLSNLETDRSKLLQIILVGQPELRKTIALPELRQLRQRISISCHIQPLAKHEIEEYILHRLEVAGNRSAVTFPEEIFDVIYSFSRGIPRLVNIICDFVMLSAFVGETRNLSAELVKEVVGELETENRYWQDESAGVCFSGNEPSPAHSAGRQGAAVFSMPKESFLKTMREVMSRISRLEEEVPLDRTGRYDMTGSVERLSAAEDSLRKVVAETKAEMAAISNGVKDLQHELATTRDFVHDAEIMRAAQKTTRKGFWRRLFNNGKRTRR